MIDMYQYVWIEPLSINMTMFRQWHVKHAEFSHARFDAQKWKPEEAMARLFFRSLSLPKRQVASSQNGPQLDTSWFLYSFCFHPLENAIETDRNFSALRPSWRLRGAKRAPHGGSGTWTKGEAKEGAAEVVGDLMGFSRGFSGGLPWHFFMADVPCFCSCDNMGYDGI